MLDEGDAVAAQKRGPMITAVVNQKGGVGKTTTAINLGAAFAAVNRRTVVVDLDPQGNASTGLGVPARDRRPSSYELLSGEASFGDCLRATTVPGLSVVPASVELSGLDLELYGDADRTLRLRNELSAAELSNVDWILIDCPPSLNLLTVNALAAASSVLVPLQCEFFALEGLSQLLGTIERVKKSLNKTLTIEGIILTMFDKRNNLSQQVAEDVQQTLGDTVFDTIIPRNVRLSEAPSHALPGLIYDHACAGSQAYIRLAGEILRRNRTANMAADRSAS